MDKNRKASIIINNYNYENYLSKAIDSALSQTYNNIEIIVVDDGSTDNSRKVLYEYGDKIIPLLKDNGGQASAFNEGFRKSSGQVIFFLDSDDVLYSDAVKMSMPLFDTNEVAKVHWPLEIIDENGTTTGEQTPNGKLPEGYFRDHALRSGPPFFLNSPTSGNAWARNFLETVLPMPEDEFRIGADTYLFETVAFFGSIKKIDKPMAAYRVHGKNNYHNKPFAIKLESELGFYNSLVGILDKYCKKLGLLPDKEVWKNNSWFHKLARAVEKIKETVPEKKSIILVDDQLWDVGSELENRRVVPFTEKNGKYGGAPENNEHAIDELEIMVNRGIDYFIIAWTSFWWLDEYPNFYLHIQKHYKCLIKNDIIMIFDLKKHIL